LVPTPRSFDIRGSGITRNGSGTSRAAVPASVADAEIATV
jgi:hypothetical protein